MKKQKEAPSTVYRNPFEGYREVTLEYIAFKMSPYDTRNLITAMLDYIDEMNKDREEKNNQLLEMVNGSFKSTHTLLAATMAGVLIGTPEENRTPELKNLVEKIVEHTK